jgi:hypothetical protein
MIARHQAWPDALARQGDDNSPAKRPGLVDRELSRSRSKLGKGFGREVGKPIARDDKARLTRSLLEGDKKHGPALANDDFVAVEMHLETSPLPMLNGHNYTPQDQGPVAPVFVGRARRGRVNEA